MVQIKCQDSSWVPLWRPRWISWTYARLRFQYPHFRIWEVFLQWAMQNLMISACKAAFLVKIYFVISRWDTRDSLLHFRHHWWHRYLCKKELRNVSQRPLALHTVAFSEPWAIASRTIACHFKGPWIMAPLCIVSRDWQWTRRQALKRRVKSTCDSRNWGLGRKQGRLCRFGGRNSELTKKASWSGHIAWIL